MPKENRELAEVIATIEAARAIEQSRNMEMCRQYFGEEFTHVLEQMSR